MCIPRGCNGGLEIVVVAAVVDDVIVVYGVVVGDVVEYCLLLKIHCLFMNICEKILIRGCVSVCLSGYGSRWVDRAHYPETSENHHHKLTYIIRKSS